MGVKNNLKINTFFSNKRGVSVIVATLLIFAIIFSATMVAYLTFYPIINRSQDKATILEVEKQMLTLDQNLKAASHGSLGNQKLTQFSMKRGELSWLESNNINLTLTGGATSFRYNRSDGQPFSLGRIVYSIRSQALLDIEVYGNESLNGDELPIAVGTKPGSNETSSLIIYRTAYDKYEIRLGYRLKLYNYERTDGTNVLKIFMIQLNSTDDLWPTGAGSQRIMAEKREVLTTVKEFSGALSISATYQFGWNQTGPPRTETIYDTSETTIVEIYHIILWISHL